MDNANNEAKAIVGLNDKFVALIEKAHGLQNDNTALETRLKILLEQTPYKSNVDDIVEELKDSLRRQLDRLDHDHDKLQQELAKAQEDTENSREKYEEELQKKNEVEIDFALNKKNADDGFLDKIRLELALEELLAEIDFLKKGYAEETKELESMVQNATVVLEIDGTPELDMKDILDRFKAHHEAIASRVREEAEYVNQQKMEDMMLEAGKYDQEVKSQKSEIAELIQQIQRLKHDKEFFTKKKESLETDIHLCEEKAKMAIEETRGNIVKLEAALLKAKQDMARQLREYQELLNVKLALDIEIATYKKLLEGEEMRMGEM